MKLTITFGIMVSAAALAIFTFAIPVFADHGDVEAVTSHATTVHSEDEHHDDSESAEISMTLSAGTDIENMQALIAVLQQLIEVLTQKMELENDSAHTNEGAANTHVDGDAHDESEHEAEEEDSHVDEIHNTDTHAE